MTMTYAIFWRTEQNSATAEGPRDASCQSKSILSIAAQLYEKSHFNDRQ